MGLYMGRVVHWSEKTEEPGAGHEAEHEHNQIALAVELEKILDPARASHVKI